MTWSQSKFKERLLLNLKNEDTTLIDIGENVMKNITSFSSNVMGNGLK